MKTVAEFLLLVLWCLVKSDIGARLLTGVESVLERASRNHFKLTFGKLSHKMVRCFGFCKVTRSWRVSNRWL